MTEAVTPDGTQQASQPHQQPVMPPTYSPDGRFWWDGWRWLPVVMPPYTQPQRQRSITGGVFLALVLFGLLVVFVFALVSEQQREEELGRQLDDAFCQSYGC